MKDLFSVRTKLSYYNVVHRKFISNRNEKIKRESFSEGKNKNVIMLMKDKLGRKIMTKFIGLWAKTYS